MKRMILLFILMVTSLYSSSIDEMKQQVEKINRGIEASTNRINTIDEQKGRTEDRIKSLELEIDRVEVEIKTLNSQISSLSKRVDYSERSLKFSSSEENVKRNEYNAKLEAWNKYRRYNNNSEDFSINKNRIKELLYSDLQRIEEIRSVQKDLDIVRIDIETDRRKLNNLRYQLVRKERQNQKNRVELSRLIKKLEAEKKQHTRNISNLQKEKKQIEKEIERIIKERARSVKNVNVGTAKTKVGRLRKPVAGNYTTRFGQIKKGNIRSSGVEIRSHLGRIVRGAADGKVIYAGKFQGLGQVVMVDYGYNMIGIYGNLISVDVKVGQDIKKAEKIGILGLSIDGLPDLYYELRFNLKPVNPVSYF